MCWLQLLRGTPPWYDSTTSPDASGVPARSGGVADDRYRGSVTSPLSPPPAPARTARWGLWDALLAWLTALFAGGLVGALLATDTGDGLELSEGAIAAVVVVQNAALFGALALVSRLRGFGNLRRDFGFGVSGHDAGWLPLGALLQLAVSFALVPIALVADLDDAPQEAVRQLEEAGGLPLVVLALGVVVLAPLAEELLFRGLLLRALLRRTTPGWAVGWSAAAFAFVHLLDPDAAPLVPGLMALGVVAGIQAVRTGSLSRPILLHAGFNLLTVVLLLPG